MSVQQIAVIGLGAMGTPIATFVLKAGYRVAGFDVVEKQMTRLAPLGLHPVKSPKQAAKGSDLIILSLQNWDIVREVVEGKDGILEGAHPGQIIIDTSTVPPWETKAMAQRLAKKGIDWMDVPISGAANQARMGNMVFMAGGKKSVFNKVKPVLDKVGKKTVYVGKNGDAALLKLIVNQTLLLNQASAIEGMVHGLKAGLNPDVMFDVLMSGAAGSDLISARGKDMLDGNFEAKGALWILIKDLGLAMDSAKRLGVVLPVTGLYQQMLLNAHYMGWDQSDATVVMKIYEKMSGIERSAKKSPAKKKK